MVEQDHVGLFNTEYESNGAVKITLQLENAFILLSAEPGDFCQLRLTEYGDMRSFVSADSEMDSYGVSFVSLVQNFNCIETDTIEYKTRSYTLSKGTFIDNSNFETMAG